MKISYAITVCNELEQFHRLVLTLLKHKRPEDEIVVLLDKPKASKQLEILLESFAHDGKIVLAIDYFEGHFADWKNKLTSFCTGDYVFQLDADEYPHEEFLLNLPDLLEANSSVDVFLVPRVNTVSGITQEHISKWGWRLDERGWINYPDYQWRIYKNIPKIKWINKVHEKLEGFSEYGLIPADPTFSLYHPKDIERQERQNNYYDQL